MPTTVWTVEASGSGVVSKVFENRASLVDAVSSGFSPDAGTVVFADGLAYIGQTGATDIPDLPGLVYAFGPVEGTLAVTVGAGGNFSNLQDACDALSVLSPGPTGRATITILAGTELTSGLVVPEGADWSWMWIAAQDATVPVGTGTYFSDTLIYGRMCSFPIIDALFDLQSEVQNGLHSVEMGRVWVRPSCGFINATRYNLEVRSTRADINSAIFDGAGEVGVRIQQASNVRAQSARADNCGIIGFDVSRASTANLMLARARNCGGDADPGAINQGGLVVRRSLVAATEFDADGCTYGISCQLSALVEAQGAILTNCTIAGGRASSMSRLHVSSANFTGSVTGVTAGFGAHIAASTSTFSGNTTTHSLFGTGATIDVSSPTGALTAGGNAVALNVPSPLGTIWRSDDDAAMLAPKHYSFVIADDAVASFLVPGSGTSRAVVCAIAFPASQCSGIFDARVTNAQCRIVAGGSLLAARTGAMTGTTGTDTFVTVSAHSDGRIYIENRTGTSQSVGITILSQNKLS